MSQWDNKTGTPSGGVSEFDAAYKAGLSQINQTPRPAIERQFVIVPDGFKVEDLSDIAVKRAPARANHAPKFSTLASFCDYLNTFKETGTRIFADPDKRAFLGVINYSDPIAGANYCDHRANYTIALSADFQEWNEKDGTKMTQEEFALFVEENAPVFMKPDAATMRELASDLQVHNEVKFQSGTRLQDGQIQFGYVEEIQGRAGKSGDIVIPVSFDVKMPIFYGGKEETIKAWFKYRLIGGKLTLWYELYRVQEVLEKAFTAAVDDIAKVTATKVWSGSFV